MLCALALSLRKPLRGAAAGLSVEVPWASSGLWLLNGLGAGHHEALLKALLKALIKERKKGKRAEAELKLS